MAQSIFLNPRQAYSLIREGGTVVEAAFNQHAAYLAGHLPGACYLDTSQCEAPPLWNIRAGEDLERALFAIAPTDTPGIIVYGRAPLAAARVAAILLHAGIRRVHVLDGGLNAWTKAGYPTETGIGPKILKKHFKVMATPESSVFLNLDEFRRLRAAPDTAVVCVRSWKEYLGDTSGYPDIAAKGRIAGSIWGGGGEHKDELNSIYRPDGSLLPLETITVRWIEAGIRPEYPVIFYCGTGWRASAAWLCARAAGWPSTFVYDGGWAEWSLDPLNPVEAG